MPFNRNDQAASLRNAKVTSPEIESKKAICCLTIASGKGGVGKTFLSVNLAVAFQKLNKKVLLVDADLGLANADIVFGVHPEFTLQDAIFKGKKLDDVVVHTDYGVDLLAASSGSKEMVELGQARMKMFIKELIRFASNYDVLLFDCAAGIDSNVTSFIAATPQAVIVATPQPTSLMDVYALIKLIHQDKLTDNVGIVVNMAEFEEQGQKAANTLKGVSQKFLSKSFDLLGIIPTSSYAHNAIKKRKPLLAFNDDDIAAVKIKEICKSILQKQHGMTKVNRIDGEKLVKGMLKLS